MPVSAMRSGTEVLQAGAARLRWQRRRLVPNFALGVNYCLMARYPPQTRYAQSSGAKIAYQVSGNGPPDLVMVPGLVSHLDIQRQQTGYRRFVRALERGGRVIRLDKRGTGLSDPVADLPTTGQRVQDVVAVMAAARSSRAVLFGLSDGGRAAIAFAAAYPVASRIRCKSAGVVPGFMIRLGDGADGFGAAGGGAGGDGAWLQLGGWFEQ